MKNTKDFNIVIVGAGGQGLITLLKVLAEAAFSEDKDVKTSELHGLSQRGGSVEVHIKIGEKVYSPLVSRGRADCVLALEFQEALQALPYSFSGTKFLINKHFIPIAGQNKMTESEIVGVFKKAAKNIEVVEAADICKKELGKDVFAGIYLLGLATKKKIIPLKPESVLAAIKKTISEKYLEPNLKAFELAKG